MAFILKSHMSDATSSTQVLLSSAAEARCIHVCVLSVCFEIHRAPAETLEQLLLRSPSLRSDSFVKIPRLRILGVLLGLSSLHGLAGIVAGLHGCACCEQT